MSKTVNTYTSTPGRRRTPQNQPIPGESQVQNNAGGFVYELDPWKQFERFLILGSTGGTYYVSQEKLTKDNADVLQRLIAEDGKRAVDLIVAISDAGRAPSNDPALYALALATAAADGATRSYALAALPKVARIPTHLFHFVEFLKTNRGWGRGLRRAINEWVNSRDASQLAYAFAKYQQRDGWSTRDVLRKAHVTAKTPEHNTVLRWAVAGAEGLGERVVLRKGISDPQRYAQAGELPPIIAALERLKTEADPAEVVKAITDFGLTREMIPTQFLKDKQVWDALLRAGKGMPPEAMIRNLGNMTKAGLLVSNGEATKFVVSRLRDGELLRKARIHPLKVVNAMKFYAQGGKAGAGALHRAKDDSTYSPVRQILDALDEAFYASFTYVEPSGRTQILALDVSGSMGSPNIANTALSPREATAVLAMVTARVESDYVILGFTTGGKHALTSGAVRFGYGGGDGVSELTISPRQRLDDVVKTLSGLPFGGTDCALPALWAAKQRTTYDAISIYTDNETWAGGVHPSQALRDYRTLKGVQTKQIVVATAATPFTIADPKDPLQLDVVGFDTNTPEVIAQFIRG